MATQSLSVQNFFTTTLASNVTSGDTTIALNAAPTPTEGYLLIDPDTTATREIIYYTSVSGSSVLLPSVGAGRGVGGTTAQAHTSGVKVAMHVTAEYWKELQNADSLIATTLTAGSGQHMTLNPGTNKLVKVAVLRDENTTAQYKNSTIIEVGWGSIDVSSAQSGNKSVTFGLAFTAAPVVLVSPISISGTTPGAIGDFNTGPDNLTLVWTMQSRNITTTSMTVGLYSTGVFAASRFAGFSYIAVGVL